MARRTRLGPYSSMLLVALLAGSVLAQTPVIGGSCKIGTADVQIGGKQTQFFLKCESTSDSADGEGVWVVKSRSAAAAPAVPAENSMPQQHPKSRKQNAPNICEQDNNAREGDTCAVSATCLQAHNEIPSSYLQCDQTSMRWTRKSCQDAFIFNFEQQTCIVPKRQSSISRQQASGGLVCTYSSCSNSNPCSSGTCNNGYCCSSGSSSGSAIIVSSGSSSNCAGCGASPQVISIPSYSSSCPGGGYSVGSCSNYGSCSTGYTCVQNSCCPSYSAPSVSIYSCPSGGSAVGSCINGGCATGYSCYQGYCCSSTTTQNPFVCPDGTQAAGGCVNGLCGTGYTCTNGLCCAGTSSSVRCLDGSEAVGACIPSCQGNACGGVQLTYFCGSGYTCTTGNICCAVNSCPNGGTVLGPTVNGLCPTGYTAQGGVCCSSVCADGSTGSPTVNGACPTGTTLTNGVCCTNTLNAECDVSLSLGPCINGGCETALGYSCNAAQTLCCPVVDYNNPAAQLGPGVDGLCPVGYTIVYVPDLNVVNGVNQGTCVSLQTVPGVCAEAVQGGPCVNNACDTGFTCFTLAGFCCPTAAFRRLRPGQILPPRNQRPTYGEPLHSYMPYMKDAPMKDEQAKEAEQARPKKMIGRQ